MSERLPQSLPDAHCVYCRKAIGAEDAFCRHCGKLQSAGSAWYYEPLWVAILAFLAIGPFALILVWKSTRMGPVTKYILAALILLYTAVTAYFL
ncbi:MAG: hypothetical protein QGG73_02830, partial [Candidatus Hydrogenedentes bacterium]|nr:hypothetical protein [Candidatus Hydrogenedentota bacterium]